MIQGTVYKVGVLGSCDESVAEHIKQALDQLAKQFEQYQRGNDTGFSVVLICGRNAALMRQVEKEAFCRPRLRELASKAPIVAVDL